MADLLKNELNFSYLKAIAVEIEKIDSKKNSIHFLENVRTDWEEMEFKDRYQKIASQLGQSLNGSYSEQLEKVKIIGANFTRLKGFAFPDFIRQYGLKDFNISLDALAYLTEFSTSEFAIRPFIEADPGKVFDKIKEWGKDKNEHIRRLSSEGIRPFLPWSQRIPFLNENPKLILNTIATLKNDPSLYVRISVANTLNDLSKIDEDLTIQFLKANRGKSVYIDWVLKKGMRTLLKEGNQKVLGCFDYDSEGIQLKSFKLNSNTLKRNETLLFSFEVSNDSKVNKKVRLEYHLFFVKKSGSKNKRVFQLFDGVLKPGGQRNIAKKYSFKDLSTRKHYYGEHELKISLNGTPVLESKFDYIA